MAKKDVKTPLKKGKAQFMLIGEAKLSEYTFAINKESDKSDWIYNTMNLGIDCGNGNVVYADMMGGYGAERDNVIYVHGVKENDNGKTIDDWDNRFEIAWEDRFDEDVLETVGDSCFIKVGIEKDTQDKYFIKKFLSAYDAIEYIQQHIENGMVLNVKGNLKYQLYNDNISVKKEINSIFLSKAKQEDYKAVFTQTLLIDGNAIGKPDKEKAVFPISAYVIDYVGKYDGQEIKKNVAFMKTFELEIDKQNPDNTKKFIKKMLTPKKKGELVEITVEGEIIEGASLVNVTLDDIPEDIKELIELNILTEEEAIARCAVGGNREKRMIIKKPAIIYIGEDEDRKPTISRDYNKYKESDLVFLGQLIDENEDDDIPFDTEDSDSDNNEDDEIDFMKLLDEED